MSYSTAAMRGMRYGSTINDYTSISNSEVSSSCTSDRAPATTATTTPMASPATHIRARTQESNAAGLAKRRHVAFALLLAPVATRSPTAPASAATAAATSTTAGERVEEALLRVICFVLLFLLLGMGFVEHGVRALEVEFGVWDGRAAAIARPSESAADGFHGRDCTGHWRSARLPLLCVVVRPGWRGLSLQDHGHWIIVHGARPLCRLVY
ncbi:hypothetical protein GGF50DRAFT_106651 [Schizophyllum commune]